jgi:AbrB family looped-hinge helix DNA binding protein
MSTLVKTRLGDGGRVIIPAEIRKALGLRAGDEIIFSRDDGGVGVRLLTLELAAARARDAVRRLVPEGRRGSEELARMRRAEAAAEAAGESDDL